MATDQAIGSLQYDRPKITTTNTQILATDYRLVDTPVDNQMMIDQWVSLDPDAVAQVSTITITAGGDGDIYDIEITDGTNDDSFSYRQMGILTSDAVAASVAARIDLHPGIRATVAGNIITVTAVVPGVTVILDESNSTNPGNLVIVETTPSSGTALYRLISQTTINWAIDTAGFPKVNYQTSFYNGADPAVLSKSGALFENKASISLDTLQTENGIDRPL